MVQISGKDVGRTGYGLLGLTWRAVVPSDEEAFAALKAALATGATFWNAGTFYGPPDNNSIVLLRKYFTKYPEDAEKVFLSVKGNLGADRAPHNSRAEIRREVEGCAEALKGLKKIDLYEPARIDPTVPLEETIQALAELVKEGVIGSYGLSEVSGETIRKAHAIHPIAAVETEISLWSTDPLTKGVASTCAELGIPLVAYSPIGRGFLTGELKKPEDIPAGDIRGFMPKFQGEAFYQNLKLVEALGEFAKKKGCTPAQLAISWVRNLSGKPGIPDVLPIPGATSVARIEENAKEFPLTEEEEKEIDEILKSITVVGARYPGDKNGFVEV